MPGSSVTLWLSQLGLDQYAEVFVENAIDEILLVELTENDLKELGVAALGHRKKILKAIAALSKEGGGQFEPTDDNAEQSSSTSVESGAGLAAWERHPGERKPVTMLFADITGSTALTEKLDAEEAHELVYGALQRLCKAIERNSGTVCRFMGDGVMAMFGAPIASEQHAVSACQAALDMQHEISDYGRKLATYPEDGIRIRVGLHSGEVVVLTVGEGDKIEYDASGPTVPIAARMEQAAEPGEIYLTAATHALAESRIVARRLEPVSVKGISEAVPVFSLERAWSAEEAAANRPSTPFVGRRSDISQFRSILDTCVEEGLGQTVYVRGEPGIGKTRLVDEFSQIALNQGAVCYRSLVLDFGAGKGQDAIRTLVRCLLRIEPGAGAVLKQRAAEAAIGNGLLEPDQKVFLNDLLDLAQPTEQRTLYDAMDNATRNQGKQNVVSQLVASVSARNTIVVIVEDIHWASSLALAHIANLARTVSGCNALLIITARAEGDPLDVAWRSSIMGSPLTTIDLGPLRKQEAMAVISRYRSVDDSLAEGCVERAAGNPLFLEQLLHNAVKGSIETLPDSIQSLVQARIDRLPPQNKRVLQTASVIGQRLSLECLRALLADPDYQCNDLVAEGLFRIDGDDVLFTHAMVRESVYLSLLRPQRCRYHAQAAAFFANSDPILYAEHLARADDPDAARAYLDAARLQSSLYRTEAALTLIDKAMATGPTGDLLYELTRLKGETLHLLGRTEASMAVWRDAVDFSQSEEQHCVALMGVAAGLRLSSDFEDALKVMDEAGCYGDEQLPPLVWSRYYNLRGNLYFPLGEIERCQENHELAMKYAKESGSDEARANALSGLADVAYLQGRMLSAVRFFGESASLAREHGLGRIEVTNALMQAFARAYEFDLQPVQALMARYLDIARLVHNRRAELMALRGKMFCIRLTGDWKKLGEVTALFRDLNRMVGMKAWDGSCESIEALYQYSIGEYEAARIAAAKAVASDKESAVSFNLCRSLSNQALLLDDEDQARELLNEGQRFLEKGAVSHNHLWFYRDAIWVCCRLGDWDLAEQYANALENYTRAEPLPWGDYYCAQARTMSALAKDPKNPSACEALLDLCHRAHKACFHMDARALETVIDELGQGRPLRFPELKRMIS